MSMNQEIQRKPVQFTGTAASYLGTGILAYLVTIFSLGILFPLAICWIYEWEIDNLIVNGQRMKFTGSAIGLFGHWIKWWVFCLFTFGIYSFWVFPNLQKWKADNTKLV